MENRIALKVIWYVLTTGSRWCDVPPEMGCSGETACTRLITWQQAGFRDRIYLKVSRLLRRDVELEQDRAIIDPVLVRAQGGGAKSGPSPVDRGNPGRKYTFVVNR